MNPETRSRCMQQTATYEDCNYAARLVGDPVYRLLLDRNPHLGDELASQPTLSRFVNAIDVRSLDRMADEFASVVVQQHRKRLAEKVKQIAIDRTH